MGKCNLACQNLVVIGDVGLRVASTVLQLYSEANLEFIELLPLPN